MRTTLDLSPLFRSTIGFDRMSRLLDAATRVDESALSYPPYNIEVLSEDAYRITMRSRAPSNNSVGQTTRAAAASAPS